MLLTLLMNLEMFGNPPVPPDRLLINVGCEIETGIIIRSRVTTGETIDSQITTEA